MPRRPLRLLPWLAAGLAALLALPVLAVLLSVLFGWNWAKAPLQDWALHKTGRALTIAGDLDVQLAWPLPRIRAQTLSFANPAWGATPQMVVADRAEISLDLLALLRGQLAFPELRLSRPQVFLEQASGGRKNWLLDHAQTDENTRIPIGRVLLDQGQVHYVDAASQTAVLVMLSTGTPPAKAAPSASAPAGAAPDANTDGVHFQARGQLRGQALAAEGSGGAVLAWRDEARPYPLKVDASMGRTRIRLEGTVTSLSQLKALDLTLELSGESLATLYAWTGVALPPTPAYRSRGRLVRDGPLWRYGPFTGQVGRSDLAGTLQWLSGGVRPVLSGALQSRQLDLADLGPAVGARADIGTRVLPDLALDTTHWAFMDADVTLQAQSLQRDRASLVDKLQLRLQLQDRLLSLNPLSFGLAGGELQAQMDFDARATPLRGHAKARLRGLVLGRLLPVAALQKEGVGRLDGDLELRGQGNSIGRMLASADGQLQLAAGKGQISRLLMEQTGLHLLEILRLSMFGDQTVTMNCAALAFRVNAGVMQAENLVLDTSINTLVGSGQIDLAQERLELTLVPRTKVPSIVALRSPIHITGSLAQPRVELDRARLAARGLGAVVLGLVNPLLMLVPLVETGPGVQAGCAVRSDAPPAPPAR